MKLSTLHGPRLAARLAAWLAAVTIAPAQAGAPLEPPTGTPDPLNARAAVPPLRYESPFAAYRPAGDVKLTPWKTANDTVTRIGGWRAYAREASPPLPAAQTPASGAAPSPAGHGTH